MALDDVAVIAELLAESRQMLHQQIRVRGQRYATGTVPDLIAVQVAAARVREVAAHVVAEDPSLQEVSSLGAVIGRGRPLIRNLSPAEELQVHLTWLRQRACDLISSQALPSVSAQALADFAVTGIAVNTSAGRLLTGDQVTDNPQLVTAKLARKPVRASADTVEVIVASYRAWRRHVVGSAAMGRVESRRRASDHSLSAHRHLRRF